MALTKAEKERLADSRMKLQTVAKSLRQVDRDAIPEFDQIESCLEDADKNLGAALGSQRGSR